MRESEARTRIGGDIHIGRYPSGADSNVEFSGKPENFAQNFHSLRGSSNSVIDPGNSGRVIDGEGDIMVSPTRAPCNETMEHSP